MKIEFDEYIVIGVFIGTLLSIPISYGIVYLANLI